MYSSHVSTILLRRFNPNVKQSASGSIMLLREHCREYSKFGGYGRRIGSWFSDHGIKVARACTRQFEFVAAQRVRRSLHLFHLYTKIWDEIALKEFIKSWRRRIGRNTREFLVSAVGVTVYNWDDEKITDEDLYSYSKEIEEIYKLRDATVVCDECHLRLVIDATQDGVEYCKCHGAKACLKNVQKEIDWEPFIERKDMLVWRKEEPENRGLYAYKVFGSFSDVSAEDFLQVQVDVDYRKVWDPTAKRLEIIDTDPGKETTQDCHSDVVYWEMIWPRLFSNRDYVFERRWVIDRDRGIIVIVSKVTDHPDAPTRSDTYRVTTYWSYMVIKPCTDFSEPGIEFGLTYFDDPGVNIPAAVTAWVAISGLPDFLCNMRQAAKFYKTYKNEHQETMAETSRKTIINVQPEIGPIDGKTEIVDEIAPAPAVIETEMTRAKAQKEQRSDEAEEQENETDDEVIEFETEKGSYTETKSEHEHAGGYLRYFFLTKLFA